MPKRKQVKSWKSDIVPESQMILRMVSVREETANEETKSVEVVIASENPVERFDRGTPYQEILLMDGVEFRTSRRQLPIVDSHDRSTVRNVLGSVRNIRIDGTELVGDASFARDADSQDAYYKLLDGHLTDFSITATPIEIQPVRAGERTVLRGVEINGPAEIVTRWTPTDASLVAAGADETSTVRQLLRAYQPNGVDRMDEEMKAKLIEKMGMPEDIENASDALDWMIQNMEQPEEEPAAELEIELEDAPAEEIQKEDKPAEEIENEEEGELDIQEATERGAKAERSRTREIHALCKKAGLTRALADQLVAGGVSLDVARQKVLERMMENRPVGTSAGVDVQVTRHAEDKFRDAARDGLIMRAVSGTGSKSDPFAGRKPADGAEDFARMGLSRLAEEILRRGNIQVNSLTKADIARAALNHRSTIERLRHAGIIREEAYHTTGLLPQLMLDAANKSLLAGYQEAPFTWEFWARKGSSVADFKAINRIRFSESPDLQVVPENHAYNEGAVSDAKESYKVEKFGRIFTVTWETVVNDDLDAISRIPQMHGAAARRTQNKKVYEVLTDNAAMADGIALFNASHSNLAGSNAAISVTSLNTAYTAMRTQTGLGGEIINVTPRYLIVPAAIEATAHQVVGSIADPSAGGSNAGNSNTLNLYGPSGPRPLTVVGDPQLDGNSITAWYLAADPSQIDTVELTFLEGEESPVLENEWDFDKDCYKYKVRQTFGVKAIDWRGLYKNAGA